MSIIIIFLSVSNANISHLPFRNVSLIHVFLCVLYNITTIFLSYFSVRRLVTTTSRCVHNVTCGVPTGSSRPAACMHEPATCLTTKPLSSLPSSCPSGVSTVGIIDTFTHLALENVAVLMPQSHPTTGPVRFLTPVRFLARKAEWSARRNFTPVLLSWSHQATGPVRLDTAVHLCFDRIIHMIHMDPVQCPYGRLTGPARESQMFFISYGIRTGPVRDPQECRTAPLWARKGIDKTIICKNPARALYVAVQGPCGPRTGCSQAVYHL